MGRPRAGPARTLTQNVPLGSRVVSQKVNFLGQGKKGGSSRLPLGEERANILLLACCYQEGWPRGGRLPNSAILGGPFDVIDQLNVFDPAMFGTAFLQVQNYNMAGPILPVEEDFVIDSP